MRLDCYLVLMRKYLFPDKRDQQFAFSFHLIYES
jgi:hypothetical protein